MSRRRKIPWGDLQDPGFTTGLRGRLLRWQDKAKGLPGHGEGPRPTGDDSACSDRRRPSGDVRARYWSEGLREDAHSCIWCCSCACFARESENLLKTGMGPYFPSSFQHQFEK